MTSQIYLINADEAPIHLAGVGKANPYAGTGEPWGAQATSPFILSKNDVTGAIWTPTAPIPLPVGRGYTRYGEVEEPVGLQAYGTTHDTAVALIRELRRTFSHPQPTILAVRPSGSTNTAYYLITQAVVQELPPFINQEAQTSPRLVRAIITWRRSPLAGRLGASDLLINGDTVVNTGTGGTPNLLFLGSTGAGDLINEGQPLLIDLDGTGTPWADQTNELFVATVSSSNGRVSTANTSSLATTSTSGVLAATITGVSAQPLMLQPDITGHVMARATSASNNLELQARVALGNTDPFHIGPWVRATAGGGGVAVLLDLGPVDSPLYGMAVSGSPTLQITIWARSTNGSTTGGSLAYVEWLDAWTFGKTPEMVTNRFVLEGYNPQSTRPTLPIPLRVRTSSTSGVFASWIGAPPVYRSGAGLWVAWRGNNNVHSASEQAVITVRQASLYHTFRGAG